jgi:hypothetical protein
MVNGKDISKKGTLIMPNNDIEDHIEQERWDYTNECNEWERGGIQQR